MLKSLYQKVFLQILAKKNIIIYQNDMIYYSETGKTQQFNAPTFINV